MDKMNNNNPDLNKLAREAAEECVVVNERSIKRNSKVSRNRHVILSRLTQATVAAQKLCAVYFNIAAEAIGEDEVRKRRDELIESRAAPASAEQQDERDLEELSCPRCEQSFTHVCQPQKERTGGK